MGKTYYYISGAMGMTSSGTFTRDKGRWVIIYQNELRDTKPLYAVKKGAYVPTNKYW
jgi:hypothetical protein